MTETRDSLIKKLDPRKYGYSPVLGAILQAITGADYKSRGPEGGKITLLRIGSDGRITGLTTAGNERIEIMSYPAFAISLNEFIKNAGLTPDERKEFDILFKHNVADWRA